MGIKKKYFELRLGKISKFCQLNTYISSQQVQTEIHGSLQKFKCIPPVEFEIECLLSRVLLITFTDKIKITR